MTPAQIEALKAINCDEMKIEGDVITFLVKGWSYQHDWVATVTINTETAAIKSWVSTNCTTGRTTYNQTAIEDERQLRFAAERVAQNHVEELTELTVKLGRWQNQYNNLVHDHNRMQDRMADLLADPASIDAVAMAKWEVSRGRVK